MVLKSDAEPNCCWQFCYELSTCVQCTSGNTVKTAFCQYTSWHNQSVNKYGWYGTLILEVSISLQDTAFCYPISDSSFPAKCPGRPKHSHAVLHYAVISQQCFHCSYMHLPHRRVIFFFSFSPPLLASRAAVWHSQCTGVALHWLCTHIEISDTHRSKWHAAHTASWCCLCYTVWCCLCLQGVCRNERMYVSEWLSGRACRCLVRAWVKRRYYAVPITVIDTLHLP